MLFFLPGMWIRLFWIIICSGLLKDYRWLKELAGKVENRVLCAAEFMGKAPELLEAQRKTLYEKMPVPSGWHEAYAKGEAGFEGYV